MGQFLSNRSQKTFLNAIKQSLRECNSFVFSVSFIKRAGLSLLLPEIEAALIAGKPGKILTSTYQNFTDIDSLEKLFSLTQSHHHFQCHLENSSLPNSGFHTKGYLFQYDNEWQVMIGSSNLTRYALLYNVEWNISAYGKASSELIRDILDEFELLWSSTPQLSKNLIDHYRERLEIAIDRWDMDYTQSYSLVVPNYMQRKALKEIRRYRDMGVNKALVIAAMGSGKTYLAAFDAMNVDARKLLFVVHRDTILHDAQRTFETVFGYSRTYGFFNGSQKDINADFLFSTNIAISTHLQSFPKDYFDYIIIDEVHHAVASTYESIIKYFTPQFLLGLTATPERMDNKNVFDLFEKNVPYELRLREALINDLVVPFKYFGIRDDLVDYSKSAARDLLQQVASDLHGHFISENIEKYHPTGKLKAIGFCSSVEHARLTSIQMHELGYVTTWLTGKNDTGDRLKAFRDIQDDHNPLEMIFTVDILNEGVDIPSINMVLFLRPTDSSTIFIQQLGRGLRKYKNKDYLIVLDFIGNSYKRSVQIAIALGTLGENQIVDKRLLSEYIRDDFKSIGLPIEIHLDPWSKDEVLRAIEQTNFNSRAFLDQEYRNFKKYLNLDRSPTLCDYLESDVPFDPMKFIRVYGSYYEFLLAIHEENLPTFSQDQVYFLQDLSDFLPIVRADEYLIIRELLERNLSAEELASVLLPELADQKRKATFLHALSNLKRQFYSAVEQNTKRMLIREEESQYSLPLAMNDTQFKDMVRDILEYGLRRYALEFTGVSSPFKLYATYTRIQFMQQLEMNTMTFREGIKWVDSDVYFFVDLKKDASKEEWLLYNDKFLSDHVLQWESQTVTTMDNPKGQRLIKQRIAHTFVRKIQKEDGIVLPYIYIGSGTMTNPRASNNSRLSILFDIVLDHPIPKYLQFDFEIGQG